jgi:hypothetical protein
MFEHPNHIELIGLTDNEIRCKICGNTRRIDTFMSDAARQLQIDYFSGQHSHSATHAGTSMSSAKKGLTYHERNAAKRKKA